MRWDEQPSGEKHSAPVHHGRNTRAAEAPPPSRTLARFLRVLSKARFHCLTPPTTKLHCTGTLSGFAEHGAEAFTAPIKCQIVANWFKAAPSTKVGTLSGHLEPLRPAAAAAAVIHSAASFTRLRVFPSQALAFLGFGFLSLCVKCLGRYTWGAF